MNVNSDFFFIKKPRNLVTLQLYSAVTQDFRKRDIEKLYSLIRFDVTEGQTRYYWRERMKCDLKEVEQCIKIGGGYRGFLWQ